MGTCGYGGPFVSADHIEIHVDETGDRGFSAKSSPYFCLAACAFRHSKATTVVGAMEELNFKLRRPRRHPMHAVDHLKTHDKLIEAVEHLAKLPVRVFFAVLPKSSTPQSAYMRVDDIHVYNFLARVLLERMSWFARDAELVAQPIFASVARMHRRGLDEYISRLRIMDTTIEWPWLNLPVEVDQARNRVGMQWADIAGRAMLKATTPGPRPPHRIEPVYLRTLAPVIWRHRPIESYGIKSVMPDWHLTQPWWNEVTAEVPEGEY